jgi:kynureninase
VETQCAGDDLVLASPRDAQQRGSHVAFRHPCAGALVKALEERGVIGGFRRPDIIRLGITPLTLRYVDLWDAAQSLDEIVKGRSYTKFLQPAGKMTA